MSSTSATRRIAFVVSCLAGQAGVLPQGGVEDRDALGERQGQVEEQGTLAGLLDRLGAELALAFGGGVRLGGEQRLVYLRGLAAAGGRPAQRGAVGRLALAEEKVIRLTLNPPTLAEAERRYLRWALKKIGLDRSALAAHLGLSERTLYRKLKAARLAV